MKSIDVYTRKAATRLARTSSRRGFLGRLGAAREARPIGGHGGARSAHHVQLDVEALRQIVEGRRDRGPEHRPDGRDHGDAR